MLIEITETHEAIEVSNKTAYKLGLLVSYVRLWKGECYVSTLVDSNLTPRWHIGAPPHIKQLMKEWTEL